MRHSWLVIVAVASLVLNLAVVGAYVYQQSRGSHRPPRPPLAGFRSEKRHEAQELFRKSWPEMKRLGEERERLRSDLVREAVKPEPDQARIDSLADELGRLHAQSMRIVCRDAAAAARLLPEDRREQFLRNFGPFGGGRGMRRMMRGRHGSPEPGPGREPPEPPPDDRGE